MTVATVHRYEPIGAPAALFRCREPEVLLSGPAGTGKSRACLEKIHATALAVPGMRALVVRKTAVSLATTGMVTFREHVVPEALQTGVVTFYSGSPQEGAAYRYANGSAVVIGGLDKATRIMSSEYDLIYVQEATELTENDWEALTTRLRNGRVSYQQLLADCNPDTPTHWLKMRCDRGATRMLHCRHEDNPRLFHGDTMTDDGKAYLSKLDALTGVRHQRLRQGLWVAAEGLIYEDWNPAVHLIDPFDIPKDWRRFWSIDFGYTNPFVCQWWAQDPDGALYMYREIYSTRRTVDQHAAEVMRLSEGEPYPSAVICDHDAEGRAVFTRETGRTTRAADKRVTVGIQAVQQRLRRREDGSVRLCIFRTALAGPPDTALMEAKKPTRTADEIPGYIWDTGSGQAPKEAPKKEDDHGCDALRYLVAHVDLAPTPNVRFL